MDELLNPYAPGAGVRPAALVGREAELVAWEVALRRLAARRPARSVVLHGLRGVGKTVLLGDFARQSEHQGWLTAQVEAGAGQSLREGLSRALRPALLDLARPSLGERTRRALRTFVSFSKLSLGVDAAGAWSVGVDLSGDDLGTADSGNLELDLHQLVRDLTALADQTPGLAILVDEAQDLSRDELVALCSLAHLAGQRGWPLLVALAGLPSLPRVLAEARSYTERLFSYHVVAELPESAAREAITQPAVMEDVIWSLDALDHVLAATRGYPYFLQEVGSATWDVAAGPSIKLADARAGSALGQARLDAGFYRARWERATPAQQAYLRAMALDGDGPSRSADVARRRSSTPTGLGPVRDGLLKKGLVYAPAHGLVAFTVPGMAEFISRWVPADG